MRLIIIREITDAEGNVTSSVNVRTRDGSEPTQRIDFTNGMSTFEAARYALLDNATDEQIAELTSLIDEWQANMDYRANQLVLHGGIVYRVQQDHRSQADWMPGNTPALFRALGTEEETTSAAPLWIQPTGGHDAYSTGDLVTYHGIVWKSVINGNVWAPSVWGWTQTQA